MSLIIIACAAALCLRSFAEEGTAIAQNVIVLDERACARPIDLKQGGQFIEPLCDLIPSMVAQQVANDSFEEEPPFKVAYKVELDKPYRPWYPDGAVHVAQYAFDSEKPFNGKRSQKITLAKQARAGISQDGFYTRKGTTYRLRLHMRGEGGVSVWASLHGGGGTVAGPVALGKAGTEWEAAEANLTASADLDNATLTIEFEGPGTLWIDRVYLIGEDAVLGLWRPDVVEALKNLNPGVIRWGGSTTEGYEWSQCIGPWDRRAPFTTCWGGLEPNFVGMEEFVQLCRHVGAEPLLCLRWTGMKPEDAAAQVAYFNGAADTHWGTVRAQNGHPEPYQVKYWQIGNEVGGKGYDEALKAFAQAMKDADPSIKILSAFLTDKTLACGDGNIDYLCPHHYGCADLIGKAKEFENLRSQIARDGGGKDVRMAVTEWNTTAGDWGLGRGMLQTLANALDCARYMNLMHHNADLVEIAIRSNLIDSFGSGVIITGPGWLYVAPTYYAHQLYQQAAGCYPLRVQRDANKPWQEQQPDISAVASEDGKTILLYAVNSTAQPQPVEFSLPRAIGHCEATVLKDTENAGCPEVMNTRDNPKRIGLVTKTIPATGAQLQFTFEPFSLTLLRLTL